MEPFPQAHMARLVVETRVFIGRLPSTCAASDKNQPFEWLFFVIYWVQLVLFPPSRGGERCTTEFWGCRHQSDGFSLQPNVSTGHFTGRDLLPGSQQVGPTMANKVSFTASSPRRVPSPLSSSPLPSLSARLPVCPHVSPLHHRCEVSSRHTPPIGNRKLLL